MDRSIVCFGEVPPRLLCSDPELPFENPYQPLNKAGHAMKPNRPWHFTRVGRLVLFLGSIELAVPVMVLVALALAWGTYLESTQGVMNSRATVYTAWWFVTLMGLIGVSLVAAVITRYPWKRRHVGFITVHTGLVILIIGGFWSLFGRVEGHIALEEGTASRVLETKNELLVLHEPGQLEALDSARAPHVPGLVSLAGIPITVVAFWENTSETPYVVNDAARAFRAIELSTDPQASSGEWVGEESQMGGPGTFAGMSVRVLPDGATWDPPPPSDAPYYFQLGSERFPLGAEGTQAMPGWTIKSIRRYERAMVSDGQLSDSGTQTNPAIEVVVADSHGTSERHTAFQNFPDMVMQRSIESGAKSGASLKAAPAQATKETLVVFGSVASPRFGYQDGRGSAREVPASPALPGTIDLGTRQVRVLRQFDRARMARRFIEAPAATNRRPAIVVRSPDTQAEVAVPWKGTGEIVAGGRHLVASFGPEQIELPFTIQLHDFRKTDYPGTEMAMAYESDVRITPQGGAEHPFLIHMNSPYKNGPWKVYQSGFSGERVSIFSVMRDPGLKLTYLGSTVLCVGIYLTFFSRTFSWGHPGIPAPQFQGVSRHDSAVASSAPRVVDARPDHAVGVGASA